MRLEALTLGLPTDELIQLYHRRLSTRCRVCPRSKHGLPIHLRRCIPGMHLYLFVEVYGLTRALAFRESDVLRAQPAMGITAPWVLCGRHGADPVLARQVRTRASRSKQVRT